MQQATSTAEWVVALLSAAYLQSEQAEAEWDVFQVKDPLGKRGLLLPVRVGEVDPPGLLRPVSMWTWSTVARPAPGRRWWLLRGGAGQANRGAGVSRRQAVDAQR